MRMIWLQSANFHWMQTRSWCKYFSYKLRNTFKSLIVLDIVNSKCVVNVLCAFKPKKISIAKIVYQECHNCILICWIKDTGKKRDRTKTTLCIYSISRHPYFWSSTTIQHPRVFGLSLHSIQSTALPASQKVAIRTCFY